MSGCAVFAKTDYQGRALMLYIYLDIAWVAPIQMLNCVIYCQVNAPKLFIQNMSCCKENGHPY